MGFWNVCRKKCHRCRWYYFAIKKQKRAGTRSSASLSASLLDFSLALKTDKEKLYQLKRRAELPRVCTLPVPLHSLSETSKISNTQQSHRHPRHNNTTPTPTHQNTNTPPPPPPPPPETTTHTTTTQQHNNAECTPTTPPQHTTQEQHQQRRE